MDVHVLVPVDGTDQAELACDLAIELFPKAHITLLHVIDPNEAGFSLEASIPSFPSEWYESEQSRAESIFDDLEDRIGAPDVEIERRVELGQPVKTILTTVEEEQIDHIVMGSTGRQGVSRVLLGSVAEAVIRRSEVPVTIAR